MDFSSTFTIHDGFWGQVTDLCPQRSQTHEQLLQVHDALLCFLTDGVHLRPESVDVLTEATDVVLELASGIAQGVSHVVDLVMDDIEVGADIADGRVMLVLVGRHEVEHPARVGQVVLHATNALGQLEHMVGEHLHILHRIVALKVAEEDGPTRHVLADLQLLVFGHGLGRDLAVR
jgi:hypothetical protein